MASRAHLSVRAPPDAPPSTQIEVRDFTPVVTRNEYLAYYKINQPGSYEMRVTVGKGAEIIELPGSPFKVVISAGQVRPERCTATFSPSGEVVAGEAWTVAVVSRDRFGNLRTTPADEFTVQIVPSKDSNMDGELELHTSYSADDQVTFSPSQQIAEWASFS